MYKTNLSHIKLGHVSHKDQSWWIKILWTPL